MKLGITQGKMQSLLQAHDVQRLEEVLNYAESTSLRNPGGFVIRALEQYWVVGTRPRPVALHNRHPQSRYITGRYAAFVEY
jgi:hypothetical protein